jgi:hypothetical protein
MVTTSRHSIYILPPLRAPRRSGLRVLFLADGNRRAEAEGGGYAAGARRVIAIAEHLAARGDVDLMVACILSPDNVEKRGQAFFAKVRDQFAKLRAAIDAEGVLVRAGIRLGVAGDLDGLRARGGEAAALAGAVEDTIAATASVTDPRLRLLFGVGYGGHAPTELDVDVVLRSGMETDGVLRLSGLASHPGILNVATTKLWPELTTEEVDRALDLAKRRVDPAPALGHAPGFVAAVLQAIARRPPGAPVHLVLPTHAPPRAIVEALEALDREAPRVFDVVAARFADRWFGRRGQAPHEAEIMGWPAPDLDGLTAIVAPGQTASALVLPERPALGQANVHACGASAGEIADAVDRATRFIVEHPPLLGADRVLDPSPDAAANDAAPATWRAGRPDMHTVADVFAAEVLAWARPAGLLLPSPGSQRASLNYVLTAFFIHQHEPDWEAAAALSATTMLAIAAGDDGVFDGVFAGESREIWWHRLEASSAFLCAVAAGDARAEPPAVGGRDLLAAIAAEWRRTIARYQATSHPAVFAGWQRSLQGLYRASLSEYAEALVDNPLVERLRAGGAVGRAAAREIEERYVTPAPRAVGERIALLLRAASGGAEHAEPELRLHLYLHDTASSIAAGLLFRTAALRTPAAEVTAAMAESLDAVTTLLDYAFRLANDVSSFVCWDGGERDGKRGACAALIPEGLSGELRSAAAARALAVCRDTGGCIQRALEAALADLDAVWPAMATAVRRGAFVGRRVYEVGHYETLGRAEMRAIHEDLTARMAEPRVAKAS